MLDKVKKAVLGTYLTLLITFGSSFSFSKIKNQTTSWSCIFFLKIIWNQRTCNFGTKFVNIRTGSLNFFENCDYIPAMNFLRNQYMGDFGNFSMVVSGHFERQLQRQLSQFFSNNYLHLIIASLIFSTHQHGYEKKINMRLLCPWMYINLN